MAANTSFADFPRLASLLARDRFMPRQFATRGDKLVFSNGIIILAVFSGVLVTAFGGDTSRLIPLYAVGVFLSFTLSQTGMVRHWNRELRTATTNRFDLQRSQYEGPTGIVGVLHDACARAGIETVLLDRRQDYPTPRVGEEQPPDRHEQDAAEDVAMHRRDRSAIFSAGGSRNPARRRA